MLLLRKFGGCQLFITENGVPVVRPRIQGQAVGSGGRVARLGPQHRSFNLNNTSPEVIEERLAGGATHPGLL